MNIQEEIEGFRRSLESTNNAISRLTAEVDRLRGKEEEESDEEFLESCREMCKESEYLSASQWDRLAGLAELPEGVSKNSVSLNTYILVAELRLEIARLRYRSVAER